MIECKAWSILFMPNFSVAVNLYMEGRGGEMRRKIFRIRISEEERERLTQLAKAWGCSRSEILRTGLKFIPMNRRAGALNPST
jgi:hypothetical protein